ncbi:MAG: beta-ketoacyl synthase N-terminal-like domain-containing protein, partial [Chthoniobacterales bacterium]
MNAVVTGIGLVSSIGNNCAEVLESLRGMRTGIAIHPELEAADAPFQLAGVIRGFEFPSVQPHTWSWPGDVKIPRTQLRSMPPHGVYAMIALHEAIAQAGLSADDLRDPSVGMLTASAGSTRLLHAHVTKMLEEGISQCHPFSITSSICGTLNYNLAAALGITGLSGGCVSACASSAQALGLALDQIRLGRQ